MPLLIMPAIHVFYAVIVLLQIHVLFRWSLFCVGCFADTTRKRLLFSVPQVRVFCLFVCSSQVAIALGLVSALRTRTIQYYEVRSVFFPTGKRSATVLWHSYQLSYILRGSVYTRVHRVCAKIFKISFSPYQEPCTPRVSPGGTFLSIPGY